MPHTPEPPCPFFMTHHGPVGAWASLTFGLPGRGVSIDREAVKVEEVGDLLVAVGRGRGTVRMLPFSRAWDAEAAWAAEADELPPEHRPNRIRDRWRFVPPEEITRRLSACVDTYEAPDFTFRVYTPHPAIPDPATGEELTEALVPAILLELEVDNTASDREATAFLGLAYWARKMRVLDWTTGERLCGVGLSNDWALGAVAEPGRVFTVRENFIAEAVEAGQPVAHCAGGEGGVLRRIAPRARETLRAAFAFYKPGPVSPGVEAVYAYTRDGPCPEGAAYAVLREADALIARCEAFDADVRARCPDPVKRQIFAQAVRGYDANAQLLADEDGRYYYSVNEGQFAWRNTLDLAVDHLPWELARMPWVVRVIMDLYRERYAYHDRVRFADRPGETFPGGLAFCHDMGSYTAWSPPGRGGYEVTGHAFYTHMTTEQVLNGVYGFGGYALAGGSLGWARSATETFRDLLLSLERRDAPDAGDRDGLLAAESTRCGTSHEITTYDALDASLKAARGNLYVAVKTWAACLVLEAVFDRLGLSGEAARAAAFAARTARALADRFDTGRDAFPANVLEPDAGYLVAALEPLAVPAWLGLDRRMADFALLMDLLRRHARTCLVPGRCIDAAGGGLRLSSGSANTWPSKAILCLWVLEEVFGVDLAAAYPTLLPALARWLQGAAAEVTLSDQVNADTETVRGGSYYPRMVTAALWTMPRPTGRHEETDR